MSLSLSFYLHLSSHMSLCLSFHLSLLTSISLHFSLSTSSNFNLFLCSLLFLSLFSFTTLFSSRLSLSAHKRLTCPESKNARALAHSLNAELLASRRKNLFRCSCALGMEMCQLCACVVVCVLCYVAVWSVATLKRATVTPVVRQRLSELLTTLSFRALGRSHIVSTAFEAIEKKTHKTEKSFWHEPRGEHFFSCAMVLVIKMYSGITVLCSERC